MHINSLRNKFDILADQIKNVDVSVISVTKLKTIFLIGQLKFPGYIFPFPRNRNQCDAYLTIFVREDTPPNMLSREASPIEGIYKMLDFPKKKWLLCNRLKFLRRSLDLNSANYKNVIIIGDLNTQSNQKCMKPFCTKWSLINLMNEQTCFKTPENPSCIDLILTKNPPYLLKRRMTWNQLKPPETSHTVVFFT